MPDGRGWGPFWGGSGGRESRLPGRRRGKGETGPRREGTEEGEREEKEGKPGWGGEGRGGEEGKEEGEGRVGVW